MEDFETKERIINLGKTIVEELKIEPGVDTLSRWMAHYVANLITKTQTASNDEKEEIEKECFEIILKIWEKRNTIPSGGRPFEEFQPIFDALEYLASESENSFSSQLPAFLREDEVNENKEVYECLKEVVEVSNFTKRIQRFFLSEAYNYAKNEKTKKWLEHVKDPNLYVDTKALFELEWYSKEFHDMSENEQEKEKYRRGLDSFLSDINQQINFLKEAKSLVETRISKAK